MPKFLQRFLNYLGSDKFYRLVIIVFIVEAIWIAVSAAYPQAFDENFHFGLIALYSHYWLPFLAHQPAHADAYGAVARDPSYLYHYLMSFPYRLIALFTKNQTDQIVILRFMNVALFTWGLVLFNKVLHKVGTSKALSNLSLAMFILIPVVPQLASQINYDNLLFPLTALMILYAFKLTDEIRSHSASSVNILLFTGAGLLTSLVKYAFLPIFAAMLLFLLVLIFRTNRDNFKALSDQLLSNWRVTKPWLKGVAIAALVLPLGMFAQRDLINLVRYHAIEPDCAKVLSLKQCLSYSPWAYNYQNHAQLHASGNSTSLVSTITYPFQWLYWMWFRLFFAISGPNSSYANYPPLPLPSAATLVIFFAGLFALVKWWRKLFRNNIKLVLIFVIAAAYCVALMGQGYYTFRYTAVLENMNGRYLVPILLLVAALFGQALSIALMKANRRKVIFAAIALLFFLEGGGVITFIARSDPSWDVNNGAIVKVNNAARKVVKKVVVKGRSDYATHLWFFN